MDRFEGMRFFVKVVESGSFAGAASSLNVSASLVSQHVKALEERLGTRLLNRTTRKLSLTETGRAFYERCVRILSDVEEAELQAGELQATPRGLLRVNATPSFGMMHLAPAITEFRRRFPAVSVDLALTDQMLDLIEKEFDVAVRVEPIPDSSLIARQLAPVRLVICAAPSYIERHGVPRTPAELSGHNCLTMIGSAYLRSWHFVDQDQQPIEVSPAGTFASNSGFALMSAALAGEGLAWLPTFLAGDALRSGELVAVLREFMAPPLTLRALYPSNRHLSAKVRSFVDFLAERFGKEPSWDAWCRSRAATNENASLEATAANP